MVCVKDGNKLGHKTACHQTPRGKLYTMLSSVRINILAATTDSTASQPHPDQKNFNLPYICLKLGDSRKVPIKERYAVNENVGQGAPKLLQM